MLDPRIDLANMLHELREKLNHIEMKLWEIPHHQEPVEEYEAVFTAPVQGDYLHPLTPTHEKPEAFSDAAYWDECTQCWMEPTTWEWDTYNYCDNANANVSYECESNTWVEGNDWSNDYASEWHDYEANTVFVEEDHGQEANAEMPVMEPVSTEPELDADGFVLETEAPMTEDTAPEMAPEMAPEPETAPMPETEPMPEIPATDMDQDDTNPPS